jgi:chromosome segregation ATPase
MNPPPPELAAAAKRIAALEADVANLRRGMVQQLTATGRLVQQALLLDQQHFAGRFLAGRQPTPQEELVIAADILGAAGAELANRGGAAAPVAGTAVTEVLRSELVARESELAEMRRQTAALQEEHGAILAGLQTRVDQAEELAQQNELRAQAAEERAAAGGGASSEDRAEALGLCSELLRTLQAAPVAGDDLQITLSVLQDALKEGGGLGTVCQAAESALVAWAETLGRDLAEAKAQLAGLDGLRSTAGEWQKQAAQLRGELDKARAEHAKAVADAKGTVERCGIIEREITKLQTERESLVRDVERLQVELGEQRRAAHEANMARTRDRQETESFRANAKQEAEAVVATAIAEAAAARQAAETATAERDQLQGKVVNAQERIGRLETERERAAAELAALRRELDAQRADRDAAQAKADDLQRQVEVLTGDRERQAAAFAAITKELAGVRAEAEAAAARERSIQERATSLQSERDKLVAERERALAEGGTFKRDADGLRSERDQLQGRLAAAGKQAEVLAAERDRVLSERDRVAGEAAQLRKDLETTRAAGERTAGERDALRTRLTAADGAAEAAMRERDQAKTVVTTAQAERDRFRAALDASQEERSNLQRAKDEQAAQLTLRLTESSRQLGELKQVHARLASENDRLSGELDAMRKLAERGKTDSVELARRAEAMAAEARKLRDAEERATAAERQAAGASRAVAERDAQLAQVLADMKRMGDELAIAKAGMETEKRRFTDAIALLKQAKGAVEEAKRKTANFSALEIELERAKGIRT